MNNNAHAEAIIQINKTLMNTILHLNEHRALLEEASTLLDDASQQMRYGGDAASSFDFVRFNEWQERYRALMMKPV